MKTVYLLAALLATSLSFANGSPTHNNHKKTATVKTVKPDGSTKIQVAILLDTSNSMDGLIEQAKSRLWNIVNTLTTLKYQGQTPNIEIGLYEYGNDGLSPQSNYIRQVAPLTTDLDLISEKLFSLRTNGGSEYCGAVIQDATKQLSWGKDNSNMKLIYIAGNEPFNQGSINYKEAVSDALRNDIYVNTIFCGDAMEGVNSFWKDGADYGKGKYFNIDSNLSVQYIVTPYDVRISECNTRINTTYISYGTKGYEKKRNQEAQDQNAQGVSSANYAERAVSKSKAAYKNDSWDLVDKVKDDKEAVSKLKKEELPKELQNKSTAEIKVYVEKKSKEREAIQKEIAELAKKRQDYIDTEAKKTKTQDDLGNAINTSIMAFAKIKGYTVEK
ncbi:MAG: VWA domain-containing protein [Flavobacterium sp.]